MFVSWCADMASHQQPNVVGKFAYTPYHVNFFKKSGAWKGRKDPKWGDIVFFAGSNGVACHVGIVEKVVNSHTVQTIEGNTSAGNNANGGQVQRRVRDWGTVGSSWYILGFAEPKYDRVHTVRTIRKAKLRKGAGSNYGVIKEVNPGTVLTITGVSKKGKYLKVKNKGWVYADYTTW